MAHDASALSTGTISDADSIGSHLRSPDLSEPVALVRWPAEAHRRQALVQSRSACLLLVDSHEAPPLIWDDNEDWVRLPVDSDELVFRARQVLRRLETLSAPARPAPSLHPLLDADGIVRIGDQVAKLSPLEARVLARLLARPGRLVGLDELVAAGWPSAGATETVVQACLRRIRRRVEPMGLLVTNVPDAGAVAELS